MNNLKKKWSLTAKLTYTPPENIREIIKDVAVKQFGEENWDVAPLTDPICKFKVLSELISLTQRDVPNADLTNMRDMEEVIEYFETEVNEESTYEQLATGKLMTLPKNLNVQLDPLRFDPKTDTMFGGRTAFPGSNSVVSSIKYRRKYESIKTTKEKPGFNNYYYGY